MERLQERVPGPCDRVSETDPAALVASRRWADLVAFLSPQQRLVVTLYYAEDQSVATIAETTQIASGTVKSALPKACTNLRRVLDAPSDDGEEARPQLFAAVPRLPDPSESLATVAIGPVGVVLKEPAGEWITLIGPDGSVERLATGDEISYLVVGPGSVVHGFGEPVFDDDNAVAPRGFASPRPASGAGETVAVGELDVNGYLEIPPFFVGNGPDGIIDRGRQVGETLIEHVDETGAPFEPDDGLPHSCLL